jgi:uncharacterized damage-inducible protein DinB
MLDRGVSESAVLADDIRRAYSGDAWHGPALSALLRDLSPTEALTRPLAHIHNIWELVVHLTSWTRETTRRLRTGQAGTPEDGDWPQIADHSASAWLAARRALAAAHDELEATARAFPDDRLSAIVLDRRDPTGHEDVTFRALLSGLAQHDAYHGGQIAILRRVLRDSS